MRSNGRVIERVACVAGVAALLAACTSISGLDKDFAFESYVDATADRQSPEAGRSGPDADADVDADADAPSGPDAPSGDALVGRDAAEAGRDAACTLSGSWPANACTTCMGGGCCAEANTCGNKASCVDYLNCYLACPLTGSSNNLQACRAACGTTQGKIGGQPVVSCLTTSCTSACRL